MSKAGRVTDKTLQSWLRAGAQARGIGGGLTFESTAASAETGRGSWILRYRFAGMPRAIGLGRYPELSLQGARELAAGMRSQVQLGVDVAAQKQVEMAQFLEKADVSGLAQAWYDRQIAPKLKHPGVVERVIRLYIKPVIGKLPIASVRAPHIDLVLTHIVSAGSPTVANDAMRYLYRLFHFAMKRNWVDSNPVAGFEISDAGGTETPRRRWLKSAELALLKSFMRTTPSFGRLNELAVLVLLALCVRKMELLSAKWSEFDLQKNVWFLNPSRTKKGTAIEIPLAPQVVDWLLELRVFACGSEYLFPARRLVRMRLGVRKTNRFQHISPDTLNVALKRLPNKGLEHFTVHDMRRTARTHLAALGVDRHLAERALNHKVRDIEGVYNLYDYFDERKAALAKWANYLMATNVEKNPRKLNRV